MKIIHGERGTGKSTNCLAYAWMTNSVIIVSEISRKAFLIKESEKMGYVNMQIVTIDEYLSHIYIDTGSSTARSIVIDDIEDVLVKIIGRKINFVTTSCEIKELGRKF